MNTAVVHEVDNISPFNLFFPQSPCTDGGVQFGLSNNLFLLPVLVFCSRCLFFPSSGGLAGAVHRARFGQVRCVNLVCVSVQRFPHIHFM